MLRCSPLWLMASAGETYAAPIATTAPTTTATMCLRDVNMAPPYDVVVARPLLCSLGARIVPHAPTRADTNGCRPKYSGDDGCVKRIYGGLSGRTRGEG